MTKSGPWTRSSARLEYICINTTTKKTTIEVIKKKNRDAQIHKARLEKAETYAEVNELREKIKKKNLKKKNNKSEWEWHHSRAELSNHETKLAEAEARDEAVRKSSEEWQSNPVRAKIGKEEMEQKMDYRWNAFLLPPKKGTKPDKKWEKWPQTQPLAISNEHKLVMGPRGERAKPTLPTANTGN